MRLPLLLPAFSLVIAAVAGMPLATAEERHSIPTLPVDPSMLQGRTLVDEASNLMIDAPGDDWSWVADASNSATKSVATYLCTQPSTGRDFTVAVRRSRSTTFAAHDAVQKVVDRIVRDTEASGLPVRNLDFQLVHNVTPLGAVHLSYDLETGPSPIHIYRYVTDDNYRYDFSTQARGAEPTDFTAFVRSFRTIRAPVEERVSKASKVTYLWLFAIFSLTVVASAFAVVVLLVLRSRRSSRANTPNAS